MCLLSRWRVSTALHLTLHPWVVAVIAPVGWQVKCNTQAHRSCSQVLLQGQDMQDM